MSPDSAALVLFGALREVRDQVLWRFRRKAAPFPHSYKRRQILKYARSFDLRNLVETGTYRGDMVWAMRSEFDWIRSVEVQPELWHRARRRFAGHSHVEILQGDSGTVLPGLVKSLPGPTLFWLDGHYSGGVTGKGSKDTPVVEELECVLSLPDPGHVILVDDARLFDGTNSYPTLDGVREFVRKSGRSRELCCEGDIIRITPEVCNRSTVSGRCQPTPAFAPPDNRTFNRD